MAGNKSGWWSGLFKKHSDRQTRIRADTGDSTVWKKGQVILGEYVVEGELGEGGMGTVYLLVRSQSTGHRFAVKKTRFRDEASQRNFLSELQTWLDLPEHPHLLACRFFRTVGDELAIFAEYVEGGSLEAWIAERRLTQLEPILDVAIQFAWGLHAAHELGLVHQDVKPGNVLMSPDGVAKVSDFGLARARAAAGERDAGSRQSVLLSCGGMTEAYCSPEQAAYHPLSRKTDIWSFGVSVLEMFTGGVTWKGGMIAGEVLESYVDRAGHSGVEADGLPLMPVRVVRVLRKCFRQKPEDRWGTMLEVAEVLKGVYRECIGREYARPTPAFMRASERKVLVHDRQTTTGVQWTDPREWLVKALQAEGRDPAEAEALLPPREGSRRVQAVSNLAVYEEARRIYERLVANGRRELERELASLCINKAFIHEHLDDAPGALALYDRALEICERLVNQEGRRELANDLAMTYQNKALALWRLGDLPGAVGLHDRAIDIREQLVNQEGRRELAHELAQTYQNKAVALQNLGDFPGAVGLYDRT
ncbi:MAG: serine/threonine-protein kinase, partial [Acidobacteria bacterium]|nr:serine/threonine-protein kinase [Acidobacteriota bacterium]